MHDQHECCLHCIRDALHCIIDAVHCITEAAFSEDYYCLQLMRILDMYIPVGCCEYDPTSAIEIITYTSE